MSAAGPASRLPEVADSPPGRGALLYVLTEPDSDLVCYVGQTRHPRARLLGHIRSGRVWLAALAERGGAQARQGRLPFREERALPVWNVRPSREPGVLEEWLALLVTERRTPRMRCIEAVACARDCGCTFVADCRQARLREAWWIERLLAAGQPLLNRTLPRPGRREAE